MKKVLVVDDSLVYRNAVKNALSKQCQHCEIYVAKNGQEALELIQDDTSSFDLIILDIEMPILDGVETTRAIRLKDKKVPIIVFAAPTQVGAKKAMDALSLGANDFIKKFDLSAKEGDLIALELIPKVVSILDNQPLRRTTQPVGQKKTAPSLNEKLKKCEMICIGSSTGGPDALRKLFTQLSGKLRVPVLMIQHMPPVFTKQFSLMLSKISGLNVVEAENGMKVNKGEMYIAPGDYHMVYDSGNIVLNQADKVCYVRPSYDVTIRSLKSFNKPVCYIILTGMGDDGADALLANKNKDDVVIIQNKESSVVWGMPGAIDARKLQDAECSIDEIAAYVNYFKS